MLVFPGLRKLISSKIQQLFNTASFDAPLTHSAIPTRAASGTTATFTRATTKTVTNNDGYLVTLLAGEIGFPGARRVRNLINAASSENLNAAGWTLATATFTGAKLSESAGVATHYAYPAALSLTAGTYIWSAEVSAAGRDYFTLSLNGAGTLGTYFNLATGAVISNIGAATGSIELLSNGNYRVSTKAVLTAASYTPLLLLSDGSAAVPSYAGDTSKGVNVFNAQLEDVTAQTTQTAGEYVSVGVESAPYYHGSFVDGVKCFPTDISGNPIPSTTLLGYQAEGARTNLCLQSDDMANAAWTSRSAGNPTRTNNLTAADGTPNKWSSVTNLGVLGVGDMYAAIPFVLVADTRYEPSFYAKQITPSGTIVFRNSYGDAFGKWTINLALLSASVFERITRSHIAVTVNNEFIGQTGTGYYQVQWYASSGSVDVGLGGAQVELGSFASSYIATTTIAVARNADVLTYSSAGNILGTAGWCYAEIGNSPDQSANKSVIGSAVGGTSLLMYLKMANRLGFYDATSDVFTTSASTLTSVSKIANSWTQGVSASGAINGGNLLSPAIAGTISNGSSLGIGTALSGNPLNTTIRNVRIGQRQLSASELQAITA